jgi:TonB family protein
MISRCIPYLGLTLIILVSTAGADDKGAKATALIEHAQRLSDIRAEGAPPFRLKLSLKVFGEDGSVLEGAYTEVWVSKTQWRRETVLGDFHRTEAVAGKKRWLLDSASAVPDPVGEIPAIYAMDTLGLQVWKTNKIKDGDIKVKGLSLTCLESDRALGGKSALCFDSSSGMLVLKISPAISASLVGDKTCLFADYQKFGDRAFARSYECDEDKHPRLRAKVVELVSDPAPDPALFEPMAGSEESGNCLSGIKPPRQTHAPEPIFPMGLRSPTTVFLRVFLGADGKPHDAEVTSAPNPGLDQAALKAIRQWTFNPATCDGTPVAFEIAVEVDFHL